LVTVRSLAAGELEGADHDSPARRTLRSASKKDLVAPTLSFNKLNACSRVRN
jgi:hypothetical protein